MADMKANPEPLGRPVCSTEKDKPGRTTIKLEGLVFRDREFDGKPITYVDFEFTPMGAEGRTASIGAAIGSDGQIHPDTKLWNLICLITGKDSWGKGEDMKEACEAEIGSYYEADLEVVKSGKPKQPVELKTSPGNYLIGVGVIYKKVPGGVIPPTHDADPEAEKMAEEFTESELEAAIISQCQAYPEGVPLTDLINLGSKHGVAKEKIIELKNRLCYQKNVLDYDDLTTKLTVKK